MKLPKELLEKNKKKPLKSEEELLKKLDLYIGKEQYSKALKVCRKLLKRKPDHIDYMYNTCIIYGFLGEINKAEALNHKILKLNQNDADALINLGQIKEMRAKKTEAEEYYLKAIKANPYKMFELHDLWNLALKKYKNNKKELKKLADLCVYEGDSNKLMNLEVHTKILGPRNFLIGNQLCKIIKDVKSSIYQATAIFSEMFFGINEVWNELLKQLNIDIGGPLFSQKNGINYEQINPKSIDKIAELNKKTLLTAILQSLDILAIKGEYKPSENLFQGIEKYGSQGVRPIVSFSNSRQKLL